MDLYTFVVYEFFIISLFVFIFGVTYRILHYIILYKKSLYISRKTSVGHKVKEFILIFFLRVPLWVLRKNIFELFLGMFALHSIIFLLFLLAQHIAWFSYYFPPYALLWPLAIPTSYITGVLTVTSPISPSSTMTYTFVNSIWGPLTIIFNGFILTIVVIIGITGKIIIKILEKAKGMSFVRPGDLVVWPLLLFIVITGFMATNHLPSPEVTTYRLVLALHVLGAELLLMVLPFTKFFHFIFNFWFGKFHEWYNLVLKRGV